MSERPKIAGSFALVRVLLVLASMATVVVALWLFFVTATVLPSRDPAHISQWRAVAAGDLLFSALSWAFLVKGPKSVFRWSLLVLAAVAFGAGLWGIARMAFLPADAHFEGYLLLMAVLLAGHGLIALVSTAFPFGAGAGDRVAHS